MGLNSNYQKCLILVPHPDDETNIAGSLIHDLRETGTEVFVCYATNGDWKYPAQVRQREALKALHILGKVEKDHVLFLGYGDAFFDENHTHLFYHADQPVRSKAGYSETYGTKICGDFGELVRGRHSSYTRTAYLEDLKDMIRMLKADLIVCSDYDEHPDHRMLTLCFEEAIGQILQEQGEYRPTVWKAFAYSTAYYAVEDFEENPLKETERPSAGNTEHYAYDLVDRSVYAWEERLSISVSEDFTERRYSRNRKAKALAAHLSQPISFRAGRIINRDEVFWERRTDSLSYEAHVTASSGHAERLNDFQLYNVRDIDSRIPEFADHLWIPDEEDEKRECAFVWDREVTVSEIRIYGDLTEAEESEAVSARFDDGIEYKIQLPARGRPGRICFEPRRIRKCVLRVPPKTGLAECEFYVNQGERRKADSPAAVRDCTALDRVFNKGWYYQRRICHKIWKTGQIILQRKKK